jgi:hypothetical protein
MAINIARWKVLVALGGTAFASPLVAKRLVNLIGPPACFRFD